MNWCILIPLLVGAICALLGYLLGKLLSGDNDNAVGEDVYKNRIAKLEADLETCKSERSSDVDLYKNKITKLETDLQACKSIKSSGIGTAVSSFAAGAGVASVAKITFDADAAKAVFGKKIKEDDLTVVEGIGPKIKELFHAHDVKTWHALSQCSIEKCQEVLNSGGDRYKIHKPGTWPKQALLASQGKWKELSDWQDKLDGGK
jgi:predicted flap endonuclease-1-like 5' DNA nuclease